ncbi:hypothetical protein HW115_18910 [Verrucomicrobiaceae bacterium N1E253]|uniref:Lipoprotein n=1 Tax=Oceaniferula marina TaxID=2748318 RepID=A0A851GK32_9BACT|nr:hypothetical protein [Oceaniferula marina]NWK57696.1 hypothetical protein [Oceaniferula marina]
MRAVSLAALAIFVFSSCKKAPVSTNAGEHVIGVFEVAASKTVTFEVSFTEARRIGFSTNISWEEMERVGKQLAPDGFMSLTAVDLNRPSDGFGLGSHFGASAVVKPEESGISKFEIVNNSNEDLTVRVYWDEK